MCARPAYDEAIARLRVMELLADHDPHIAGTPPLGLDTPDSDIDILCHAPDQAAFADLLWRTFGDESDFRLRQWTGADRPIIASFGAHGWPIEIFGAMRPVAAQEGWRHFEVERRLLALGCPAFRAALVEWRRKGARTEPAFAAVLNLAGDPYRALFDLHDQADQALATLLARAGFTPS